MQINKDMKLAEAIHLHYLLVPVLRRFNIQLGFGDMSIAEVCQEHDIEVDFFLEIVNVCADKNYFPQEHLKTFAVPQIIRYLLNSHKDYRENSIPLIEKNINLLQWSGDDHHKNLSLLHNFFCQYSAEVFAHLSEEENGIYPYILQIDKAIERRMISSEHLKKLQERPIYKYAKDHTNLEDKLFDLKNIIIKYLPPPENYTVYQTVLFEIFKLEDDLNTHAMIEEKVLVPKVKILERKYTKLTRK